ncbi:MAG: hypothetical protein IJT58_00385 [Synergistaceae bacterium]|nr:hypothetical protein [Synergistaceae bacterium]
MKTLQELYNAVKNSDELKKAFAESVKSGKLDDFLKAHECNANADELREFIAEKVSHDKPIELSMEELDNAAGGTHRERVLQSEGCADNTEFICFC